jgi:hypothetical protein
MTRKRAEGVVVLNMEDLMKCKICRTDRDCQIIDQDSETFPGGIAEHWRTWKCGNCETIWDEWGDNVTADGSLSSEIDWDGKCHDVSWGEKSDEIEEMLMAQDKESALVAEAQSKTIPLFGGNIKSLQDE